MKNNKKLRIGLGILLAVLLLSVAFSGFAAADIPEIITPPEIATGLVYDTTNHPLLSFYGEARGSSGVTFMQFSLDKEKWVYNTGFTDLIKSAIVGKNAGKP